MTKGITVALAGNPNSGKTTIFNSLTRSRQHVGNYPGVTVEKKEGICRHADLDVKVVDLPGTYSLTTHSVEEVVARNFLLDEKPDVVVDVIDASNIERNLYLAVQLIELGVPLVLAFNMSDLARARGLEFDLKKLSTFLGAPIVPTVGHKGHGTEDLLNAIVSVAGNGKQRGTIHINYGQEIEKELAKLQERLREHDENTGKYGTRWLAVKLLENDEQAKQVAGSDGIAALTEESISRLEKLFGESPEIVIAERRYGFISGVCQDAVRSNIEVRHTMSDQIDTIVLNRVLGIPIFLGLMYLVFHLTFTLGTTPMEWLETFFGWMGNTVTSWWPKGTDSTLHSLLVDGIIGGVGGVLIFLPNIILLFLAIAILEASGYMARAAFIMDRLMHKIGLHGKSFIPLLTGFGCSVPAIMATRTLESERDRLTTMMVTPLMSCGARLPIYVLIIPAFFPAHLHGPMLWSIYLIGVVLAIAGAKLLRSTILRGDTTPLVMELPPYRIPTLRGVAMYMWNRASLYLKKAGGLILAVSVVLWVMTTFPQKSAFDRDYDAETAQAEAAYLESVAGLNADLNLPAESNLLTNAAQAEITMLAEQERFHEHESGYVAAQARMDARIDDLLRSQRAPALARFLETRAAVEGARARFEMALQEGTVAEDPPAFTELEGEHLRTLARIESKDPETYAALVTYLDEVRAPYKEELVNIAEAQLGEELAYSTAGRVGRGLEPLLKPMGFDWKIGTALIGAFAAKEVFVAQMGIVYSVGEADEDSAALRTKLSASYTPLTAFCIMLFCLISAPCMATIAVTKRESNSWKWALLQLGGLTALAYVLTVFVHQAGTFLGVGT